ncbi:MAG: tetratricopeptide repeat protein [Nitrospirota bacterium]
MFTKRHWLLEAVITIVCLVLFPNQQVIAAEVTEERIADGFAVTTPKVVEEEKEVAQMPSPFSPEVEAFIENTEFVKASNLPDRNESVEALRAYLEEVEKVKHSIKRRGFGEPIDTEGESIVVWLEKSVGRLLSMRDKYPESRHLYEGLGRIYRELYYHSQRKEYLEKAADAFTQAEDLGAVHAIEGNPFIGMHYVDEMTEVLSIVGDRKRVDKYFSRLITPTITYTYLNYAKVLSKLNDPKAEEFFEKVLTIRQDGDINPVVEYAEYLLDRGKNKEALCILQQLNPSEDYSYTYFLKGFALERMGKLKKAEEEYKKYLKFSDTGGYRAPLPTKYKIPGSKLQKDIFFKSENSKDGESLKSGTVSAADIRDTSPYCSSTDWACKARYYMVWTINGEAEKAGSFGSGTVGMMRAVGWNIRTRVNILSGTIDCVGTQYCFHNAPGYTIPAGDVTALHKRYYYVIEKGVYEGLKIGSYTSGSAKVYEDVFNGRVPDPIAGKCLYGTMSGEKCNGTCTSSGIWNSFWASQSGQEFRAGKLEWYWNPQWGTDGCYRFVPMYSPTGAYCGINCWKERGVICPVVKKLDYSPYRLCSGGYTNYPYNGPVYGNFFWSFNR